jgi:hypothetical protein
MPTLLKSPIFVDFDRRRQVVFNLNTEILIRAAGGKRASLWETVGEQVNAAGETERLLDVNLENLRLYLWAALQEDALRHDQLMTLTDVGAILARRKWVTKAVVAVGEALKQYYGDDPGEAPAPAAGV